MSVFSKILESLSKTISKELDKNASKNTRKQNHKEQRGIYNVTYNGKNRTMIYRDLDSFNNAIAYTKGTKRKGGAHIRLEHSTDSTQQGYVTPDEVANLGQNIRKFISTHGDPHIDKNGARLYEWKDDKGNSFRAVVNDMPKKEANGGNSLLPSASEEIITFYSDRNLQKGKIFEFKNPKLKESTTLINDNLPPMMRE